MIVTMLRPEADWPELKNTGISVHSLEMQRGQANLVGFFRCFRLLRQWRPDVVHSHMYHANILGRLVCMVSRVGVNLSTAHSVYEGGAFRMALYRLTDRLARVTTNVSCAAFDRYIRIRAISRRRGRYMPNGVDLNRFQPNEQKRARLRSELKIRIDDFIWLAVGRLAPAKDYPNLVCAARQLERNAGPNWSIFIAGGGAGAEELMTSIREAGLQNRIVLLGSRNDVPDLLKAADGYIMSSAWEGLPMALLEAAASGLPIVATDVGGNGEVVVNGHTGILVPPANACALGQAMAGVMALSPDARAQLGRNGRQMVERQYDIQKIAEEWLEIYRKEIS
jgi:glycosyltransferase involved in cell wall biosynthesis